MVNNTANNNLAREIDKLNENETRAVVSYISQLLSKRISKQTNSSSGDDLIKSLSEAYENKRARQVLEWEKLRRQQNYGRAA
jgi:hypothetical protein